MEDPRQGLTKVVENMSDGKGEHLRALRQMMVDFDLTVAAPMTDAGLFAALYLSKKLTADVWENLATDASFDFGESLLDEFTRDLGRLLRGILSEGSGEQSVAIDLGKIVKWLYSHFALISENPRIVFGGGDHEPTQL